MAPTRKPSILIADDHAVMADIAFMLLKNMRLDVEVVTNGTEVIEHLQSKPCDIVLMNVEMPAMNGYEATNRIREIQTQGAIAPVIIIGMTAHSLLDDREKCLAAGMDGYVAKPLTADRLIRALSPYLVNTDAQ